MSNGWEEGEMKGFETAGGKERSDSACEGGCKEQGFQRDKTTDT